MIVFSPTAREHLLDIYSYIAFELADVKKAERVIAEIQQRAVQFLKTSPYGGRAYESELERFMPFSLKSIGKTYVLKYAIREKHILVTAVHSEGQN